MPYLRQSTAQTFRFGPFLDATDGVTEETGLTITPALRRLSKDGGAFAAASGAVNATHDSDGWYSASLTTTDTDTVGELILNVQVPATHLPVWMRWWVLEEAIYDALFGASAAGFDSNQRIDLGSWLGTAAATPNTAGVPLVDQVRIVGGLVPAPTTTGVPDVNVERFGDQLLPTPAVTGVPDVNMTHHVDVAASVTTGELDVNVGQIIGTAPSLTGGDIDVNVAAMAAETVTASAIATGAIDADALATDAVDEIRDAILPTSNAALSNIEFLFVAASDHVTPVTAASTISGTRSIDGGAFAAVSGTIAEVGNGIYQFDALAADMNGGIITFRFIATGGTPGAPDDRFLTIVTGAGV